MMSRHAQQTNVIHILPNISRSKTAYIKYVGGGPEGFKNF